MFITVDGIVKLGDLGLGRHFTSKTTVAQSPIVTRHYMSPECIQNVYTFKSDVWSLGCLLYEVSSDTHCPPRENFVCMQMATLQSPFYGKNMNMFSLCKKIEQCDYPPLQTGAYSKDMCELVTQCIRVSVDARANINHIAIIAHRMHLQVSIAL